MGNSTGSKTEEIISHMRGRRWTAADAALVLSAWESSGLSMAAFARRHGLTGQRIAWWRERLGKLTEAVPPRKAGNAPLCFVPAILRESPAGRGDALVTIRVPGGVEMGIVDPAQVSPQWLSALIRQCGDSAP